MKNYSTPTVALTTFDTADVITASGISKSDFIPDVNDVVDGVSFT